MAPLIGPFPQWPLVGQEAGSDWTVLSLQEVLRAALFLSASIFWQPLVLSTPQHPHISTCHSDGLTNCIWPFKFSHSCSGNWRLVTMTSLGFWTCNTLFEGYVKGLTCLGVLFTFSLPPPPPLCNKFPCYLFNWSVTTQCFLASVVSVLDSGTVNVRTNGEELQHWIPGCSGLSSPGFVAEAEVSYSVHYWQMCIFSFLNWESDKWREL